MQHTHAFKFISDSRYGDFNHTGKRNVLKLEGFVILYCPISESSPGRLHTCKHYY